MFRSSDNPTKNHVIISRVAPAKQPEVKAIEPRQQQNSNLQLWAALALIFGWLIPTPWSLFSGKKN